MNIIYAIIKDSDNSKLRKILEYPSTSRPISDSELCQFHNYAVDLYQAYSSCLPTINVNQLYFQSSLRREAVQFEDTIQKLKDKYKDKPVG